MSDKAEKKPVEEEVDNKPVSRKLPKLWAQVPSVDIIPDEDGLVRMVDPFSELGEDPRIARKHLAAGDRLITVYVTHSTKKKQYVKWRIREGQTAIQVMNLLGLMAREFQPLAEAEAKKLDKVLGLDPDKAMEDHAKEKDAKKDEGPPPGLRVSGTDKDGNDTYLPVNLGELSPGVIEGILKNEEKNVMHLEIIQELQEELKRRPVKKEPVEEEVAA